MSLKDRIALDRSRVFINLDMFGSVHTWNGKEFSCVTDDEVALKRKNNNVVDISWDNNTTETVVYCRKEDFPGRAAPNEHGFFDKKPMKILQVQDDMDMLTITIISYDPKAVRG